MYVLKKVIYEDNHMENKEAGSLCADKKIYLHIGYGKTGTSSIQDMMFHNKDIFKINSLYYPDIGLWGSAHHHLSQLPGQTNYIIEIKKNLIKIKEKFTNSDSNIMLISSENLCFTKRELIEKYRDVFDGFDVQIIMYVRNQKHLIPSTYLEWVKSGWDYKGDIAEFFQFNKLSFDFLLRLSDWESIFGTENIKIRVYDKNLFEDVCINFLECIELVELKKKMKYYRSNLSLSPIFCNVVKIIDSFNLSSNNRSALLWMLVKMSKCVQGFSNDMLLSKALKGEIKQTYYNSNIKLAKRYLSETEQTYFLG